jgi:hypothetical protein
MLTVWYLVSKVLEEWGGEFQPLLAHLGSPALWPSERGRTGRASAGSMTGSAYNVLG